LLEYLRHYPETQIDARGIVRKVWVFEFMVHEQPDIVHTETDYTISNQLLALSRAESSNREDEESIVETTPVVCSRDDGFDPQELEAIRKRLLSKSPQNFEHFISSLLSRTGFDRVSVTKFSQDGGIDVIAYASRSMWAIENLLIQIQAKRWLHTVGRKEVAELRGSLGPHARGAIVTTSHYSKAAIGEANAAGKAPIVLVDGYSLASIVKSSNLENHI
jgi:hypothetical protein